MGMGCERSPFSSFSQADLNAVKLCQAVSYSSAQNTDTGCVSMAVFTQNESNISKIYFGQSNGVSIGWSEAQKL